MNYPIPTALKMVSSGVAIDSNATKAIVIGSADVPKYLHLSKDEKAVWRRTAEQLIQMGLFTGADYDALAQYSRDMCWADRLRERIAKEGETIQIINNGGKQSSIRNQAVTTLAEVLTRCNQFRNEFGMNAVARMRVHMDANKQDKKTGLLDFIQKR